VSVRVTDPETARTWPEDRDIEVKAHVFRATGGCPEDKSRIPRRRLSYRDLGKIDASGYVHISAAARSVISGGSTLPKEIESEIDAMAGRWLNPP